jgi:hypothetical protein
MAVIEAIETVYLEADATSVTFADIPSTYEHLQLRMSIRDGSSGSYGEIGLQFNTVTTTTYSYHRMTGNGTAKSAAAYTGINNIAFNYVVAESEPGAYFSSIVIDILDYANGSKNTTTSALMGSSDPGGDTNWVVAHSGLWASTAVVDEIKIIYRWGPNIKRGSVFNLYGLRSS